MNKRIIIGIFLVLIISIMGCSRKYTQENDFEAQPIDGGRSVKITKYVGDQWEVNIPPKIQGLPVTHIGEEAFASKNLIKITIPNNVTSIGDYAFFDNQLTNITIPNSITNMGIGAFWLNDLTNVTIPRNLQKIENRVFGKNRLISITIPNNIISIGDYAFYDNSLESVIISEGVKLIGEDAFGVNRLTSINIPNSVTFIGGFAFTNNNNLTSITIGSDVTFGITDFGGSPFFNYGFEDIYDNNNKSSGTYKRTGYGSTDWIKQ